MGLGWVGIPDKRNPLSDIRICMAHFQWESSYRAILHTYYPRGHSRLVSGGDILPPSDVIGKICWSLGLVVLQVYMREPERGIDEGDKLSGR